MEKSQEIQKFGFDSFLNSFDFLSIKPELKINGYPRLYTKFGIIIGFSSIIAIFIISSIFISEVLSMKKINMIYNLDNRQTPIINLENHQLGIGIVDTYGKELTHLERILEIYFRFWNYTAEYSDIDNINRVKINANFTQLYGSNCSQSFSGKNNYFQTVAQSYKTLLCFDFGKNNISLHGKYGATNGFSTFNVYFNKCKNTTEKSNCLPNEEIEKILQNFYLVVITDEFDVVPEEIEQPLVKFFRQDMIPLTSTLFKKVVKEINKVYFNNDKSILTQKIEKLEGFRSENIVEYVDIKGDKTLFEAFSQLTVRCSGKNEIFTRSFLKIQTAFANIVGLIQIIFLIGRIFLFNFGRNSIMNFLISHTFESDLRESIVSNNKKKNLILESENHKNCSKISLLNELNKINLADKYKKQDEIDCLNLNNKKTKISIQPKDLNIIKSIQNNKLIISEENLNNTSAYLLFLKNKLDLTNKDKMLNKSKENNCKKEFGNKLSIQKKINDFDLMNFRKDEKILKINCENKNNRKGFNSQINRLNPEKLITGNKNSQDNSIKNSNDVVKDRKEKVNNKVILKIERNLTNNLILDESTETIKNFINLSNIWEKFCFNFCICKKNKRVSFYLAKEIINKKLSLENFLINFSRLDFLIKGILDPGQKFSFSNSYLG